MIIEYLIIGQGISGTWLSYYLNKAGRSFLIIDNNQPNSASRIAAGIINPVTGRRIVKTWMIDELLSHLVPAYEELGKELGIQAISQKNIIDFHPTLQMKLAFEERSNENETYLNKPKDQYKYIEHFNYDFGFGEVAPCYLINLQEILPAWRKNLLSHNQLLEENFETGELKITDGAMLYKNIIAKKIIFCDGIASANSTWFKNLPFSLNKGEALIIEAPGLPQTNIFKKGLMLTPLQELGSSLFWLGSNYIWDSSDTEPTKQFREQAEQLLKSWLKVPFKILDHKAAIRPANIERRPFVGLHPAYENIALFNGMGTKGCSLAPYFARQLTDHLIDGKQISPEADIKRFTKILIR